MKKHRSGHSAGSVYPPLLAYLLVACIAVTGLTLARHSAAASEAAAAHAGRARTGAFVKVPHPAYPFGPGTRPAGAQVRPPTLMPQSRALFTRPPDNPNETLVRDVTTHKIDLLWGGVRYQFNSSATSTALGFAGSTVLDLADSQVQAITRGPNLRLRLAHGLVFPLSPIACGHARLSLSLPAVPPGTALTLDGQGFAANETVQMTFAGATVSVLSESKGSFTYSLTVPSTSQAGTILRVYAYGTTSHTFEVEPISVIAGASPVTVSANPVTFTPGTAIQVSGTGFAPNEEIDLFLSQGVSAAAVTADAGGSFTAVSLPVPASLHGNRASLIAFGLTSKRLASTTLTSSAAPPATPHGHVGGIQLDHYVTGPGGVELVNCSGFAAGEQVNVRFNGLQMLTLQMDATGAYRGGSFVVPTSTANGIYAVVASGVTSHRYARTSLTVQTLAPRISVSPGEGTAGTLITVNGQGFAGGEVVTLALSGQALQTTPSTVVATPGGTFVATFSLPVTGLSGINTLVATGASSLGTASASLDVHPLTQTTWYFAGGNTRTGYTTQIALVNPGAQQAHVTLTYMFTAGAPVSSTIVVPATSRATVDPRQVAGSGRDVFTEVTADQPVGAQETVYRDGKDFSTTLGVNAPLKTWYLAEGYTGLTFHEYLRLFNPGLAAAHAVLRFLPFNGRPAVTAVEAVPPRSGLVVDANTIARNQSISVAVESDQPVIVDRLITFGADSYGATEQTASSIPASTWLFAEGSTLNGFETFLTILNPSTSRRATVSATFYDQKGAVLGSQTILIDAHRRGNIRLNGVVHAAGVATILSSNVPVIAERPLYFGPPNGSGPSGGSDVFGRNGGGTRWLFPEGNTAAGAREFLLLFNPTVHAAPVVVRFFETGGHTVSYNLLLQPKSRTTLDVLHTVTALPPGQHGALVTSLDAVPIVVEQSIYVDGLTKGDATEGIAQ